MSPCVPGEFGRVRRGVNWDEKSIPGGEIGSENHSGLRQLWKGSRRGARGDAPRDLSATRAAAPRWPTSATIAQGRCPAAPLPAAVAGRRPRQPLRASFPSRAARGHVLRPLYDGKVGLSLLAGPAHAGKVALLLERYLARLDDEPTLIVPNASDVDRVERDLLARCGCLFSGSIGTFDDLFGRLVRADPGTAPGRDRRPAGPRRAPRARIGVVERPRTLGPHRRLRRHPAADAR